MVLPAKRFNVVLCEDIIAKWIEDSIYNHIHVPIYCHLVKQLVLHIASYSVVVDIVLSIHIISLAGFFNAFECQKREEAVYVRFRISGNKEKRREMKVYCKLLKKTHILDSIFR